MRLILFLLITFLPSLLFGVENMTDGNHTFLDWNEQPVYVYGDISSIEMVFNFIKDFFTIADNNGNVILTSFLYGGITLVLFYAAKSFYKGDFRTGLFQFAWIIALFAFFVLPNSGVVVVDTRNSNYTVNGGLTPSGVTDPIYGSKYGTKSFAKVDDIPFFLAFSTSISSVVGFWLTNIVDDAFMDGGNLIQDQGIQYSAFGLGTQYKVMMNLNKVTEVQDANMSQYVENFSTYLQECILGFLYYEDPTLVNEILQNPDRSYVDALDPDKINTLHGINIGDVPITVMPLHANPVNNTCALFWTNEIASKPNVGLTAIAATLEGKLSSFMGGINISSLGLTMDAFLDSNQRGIGSFRNTLLNVSMSHIIQKNIQSTTVGMNATDLVTQTAVGDSLTKLKISGIGQFVWMLESIPKIMHFLFALMIALYGPMVIVSLFIGFQKGVKMMYTYISGLVAFQTIHIVLAIVQRIMTFYGGSSMIDMYSTYGKNLYSVTNIPHMVEYAATMAGITGMLGIASIPLGIGIIYTGNTKAAIGLTGALKGLMKDPVSSASKTFSTARAHHLANRKRNAMIEEMGLDPVSAGLSTTAAEAQEIAQAKLAAEKNAMAFGAADVFGGAGAADDIFTAKYAGGVSASSKTRAFGAAIEDSGMGAYAVGSAQGSFAGAQQGAAATSLAQVAGPTLPGGVGSGIGGTGLNTYAQGLAQTSGVASSANKIRSAVGTFESGNFNNGIDSVEAKNYMNAGSQATKEKLQAQEGTGRVYDSDTQEGRENRAKGGILANMGGEAKARGRMQSYKSLKNRLTSMAAGEVPLRNFDGLIGENEKGMIRPDGLKKAQPTKANAIGEKPVSVKQSTENSNVQRFDDLKRKFAQGIPTRFTPDFKDATMRFADASGASTSRDQFMSGLNEMKKHFASSSNSNAQNFDYDTLSPEQSAKIPASQVTTSQNFDPSNPNNYSYASNGLRDTTGSTGGEGMVPISQAALNRLPARESSVTTGDGGSAGGESSGDIHSLMRQAMIKQAQAQGSIKGGQIALAEPLTDKMIDDMGQGSAITQSQKYASSASAGNLDQMKAKMLKNKGLNPQVRDNIEDESYPAFMKRVLGLASDSGRKKGAKALSGIIGDGMTIAERENPNSTPTTSNPSNNNGSNSSGGVSGGGIAGNTPGNTKGSTDVNTNNATVKANNVTVQGGNQGGANAPTASELKRARQIANDPSASDAQRRNAEAMLQRNGVSAKGGSVDQGGNIPNDNDDSPVVFPWNDPSKLTNYLNEKRRPKGIKKFKKEFDDTLASSDYETAEYNKLSAADQKAARQIFNRQMSYPRSNELDDGKNITPSGRKHMLSSAIQEAKSFDPITLQSRSNELMDQQNLIPPARQSSAQHLKKKDYSKTNDPLANEIAGAFTQAYTKGTASIARGGAILENSGSIAALTNSEVAKSLGSVSKDIYRGSSDNIIQDSIGAGSHEGSKDVGTIQAANTLSAYTGYTQKGTRGRAIESGFGAIGYAVAGVSDGKAASYGMKNVQKELANKNADLIIKGSDFRSLAFQKAHQKLQDGKILENTFRKDGSYDINNPVNQKQAEIKKQAKLKAIELARKVASLADKKDKSGISKDRQQLNADVAEDQELLDIMQDILGQLDKEVNNGSSSSEERIQDALNKGEARLTKYHLSKGKTIPRDAKKAAKSDMKRLFDLDKLSDAHTRQLGFIPANTRLSHIKANESIQDFTTSGLDIDADDMKGTLRSASDLNRAHEARFALRESALQVRERRFHTSTASQRHDITSLKGQLNSLSAQYNNLDTLNRNGISAAARVTKVADTNLGKGIGINDVYDKNGGADSEVFINTSSFEAAQAGHISHANFSSAQGAGFASSNGAFTGLGMQAIFAQGQQNIANQYAAPLETMQTLPGVMLNEAMSASKTAQEYAAQGNTTLAMSYNNQAEGFGLLYMQMMSGKLGVFGALAKSNARRQSLNLGKGGIQDIAYGAGGQVGSASNNQGRTLTSNGLERGPHGWRQGTNASINEGGASLNQRLNYGNSYHKVGQNYNDTSNAGLALERGDAEVGEMARDVMNGGGLAPWSADRNDMINAGVAIGISAIGFKGGTLPVNIGKTLAERNYFGYLAGDKLNLSDMWRNIKRDGAAPGSKYNKADLGMKAEHYDPSPHVGKGFVNRARDLAGPNKDYYLNNNFSSPFVKGLYNLSQYGSRAGMYAGPGAAVGAAYTSLNQRSGNNDNGIPNMWDPNSVF